MTVLNDVVDGVLLLLRLRIGRVPESPAGWTR
jgi:hypothetical protein